MTLRRRVADVSNWHILADRIERETDSIGFDTESHGPELTKLQKGKPKGCGLNLQKSQLTGFSVAFENEAWYVPVAHRRGNLPTTLGINLLQVLRHAKCDTWAHLWKHDYQATLPFYEVPVFGPRSRCSLLAAWMGGEVALGLKSLAERLLGASTVKYDEVTRGRGFDELDPTDPMTIRYTTDDAINTLQLGKMMWKRLKDTDQLPGFLEQEMPFVEVLARMEMRGMLVDSDALCSKAVQLQERIGELVWEWDFLLPGVSISSPAQVGEALIDGGHWPKRISKRSTKTGKWKVDKDVTKAALAACRKGSLGSVAAEIRQEYQDLRKNLSTYTLSMSHFASQHADGRLRPTWNQHIARTGRLSCSLPSLMNIPARTAMGREIKSCFLPKPGYRYVSADYGQIELRYLAHLAGEGRLRDAYQKGLDVHQQTAEIMGCDRDAGKKCNFSKVYMAGPWKLSRDLGCTVEEAKAFIKKHDEAYPETVTLRKRIIAACRRRGWVKTLSGRRRYIPGINSIEWRERGSAERQANNTPVQGSAADIAKRGMLAVAKAGYWPICQVHDEVLLEVKEEEAEEAKHVLQKSLENAVKLSVPLVAEPVIGANWGECK